VTLRLPSFKRPHLRLYQALARQGALIHVKGRKRRSAQQRRWHSWIRSTMFPEVLKRGLALGLSGERLRQPDWSREQAEVAMEVDHIIELQVTRPGTEEIWDHPNHYELLDRRSNGRSGSRLRANIAGERRALARQTGDNSWRTRDLVFDQVIADAGPTGERWLDEEIQRGDHLDSFERHHGSGAPGAGPADAGLPGGTTPPDGGAGTAPGGAAGPDAGSSGPSSGSADSGAETEAGDED
jgi:hypothetical protein